MHAHRFREQADVLPLPFAPLSRTISLTARRDVLQDIPARTAARLRSLVQELIVAPSMARMPWLARRIRGWMTPVTIAPTWLRASDDSCGYSARDSPSVVACRCP